MGKRTNKVKRGEVKNTDFQTPKNGSKRRQNFSPSGLTPEEKVVITKPGSTGVIPPTSLSADDPVNPPGRVPPGGSPELVSEAPPGARRPGGDPDRPNVASGSGGLGEDHDLIRGTPFGPGASTKATKAPLVEAAEGPSGPNSPGTSKGPAKAVPSIKLGHLADLLGLSEAEVARDPLCRVLTSSPDEPMLGVGLKDGSKLSSEALEEADGGLLHPNSEEALSSPTLVNEDEAMTEDSFRTVVTSTPHATPSTSGAGTGQSNPLPEPQMAWGDNITSVLSKDKARKLRRKEHMKKAKALKAASALSEGAAALKISDAQVPSGSQGNNPKKADGPKAKSFANAAKPKEFIRGFALLNIQAIGTDKDGNPKPVTIPKSKWLAFIGEFQSKLTEGWEFDRSILLNAPKTHWIGWRSGRGQILSKDKDGTDRLVSELTDHPISIKGSKCKLAVNYRDREKRPDGKWCGVFLPAFHIVPDVEICKILAGSGFTGSVTQSRIKCKVTDNGSWIKFQADPKLVAELMAIQTDNLAPAIWVGMDVKIRIFGREEDSAPDDPPPQNTEDPMITDQ